MNTGRVGAQILTLVTDFGSLIFFHNSRLVGSLQRAMNDATAVAAILQRCLELESPNTDDCKG